MRYINRTGIATPIGKIVKLDTDSKGVVLSQPADTDVLGVVTAMEGKIAIIEESGIFIDDGQGIFQFMRNRCGYGTKTVKSAVSNGFLINAHSVSPCLCIASFIFSSRDSILTGLTR